MVQSNKFHGLPLEDPLDHLDNFDRLCNMTKMNGVSEDSLKLRLFPFSLGDKAHLWEKNLAQGSITSWEQCKTAFLSKFFSTTRTARIRNEISSFAQKTNESFGEAWERFKGYTLQCPHHGFSTASLLSTLYRGALPKIRMLLDTASNGNFLAKDIDEGLELVENLATSDGNYGEDYDRTNRGSREELDNSKKELKALHEKLDLLLSERERKEVHYVGDMVQNEGDDSQQEEVNYVSNQGGYNYNNYNNNPLSYRNTNVANPQDQVYPTQAQPQAQQQGGQGKPFINYSKPYQGNSYQGNKPQQAPPGFNSQGQPSQQPGLRQEVADMKTLIHQVLQLQNNGQIEMNKRFAEVNNRIDSNHVELNKKVDSLAARVKTLENNKGIVGPRPQGTLPGNCEANPKEYCQAILTDMDTTEDEFEDIIAEFLSTINEDIEVQEGGSKPEKSAVVKDVAKDVVVKADAEKETATPFTAPLGYKPALPFPGRFKKQLVEKYTALYEQQLRLRGLDPETYVPKEAAEEGDKVVKKLEDPGRFTLSCELKGQTFKNCLCDLGASINLLPLKTAKALGYHDLHSSGISLTLADGSVKKPLGMLKDIPMKMDGVAIPTDFQVIDVEGEIKNPIVLGRPFLASAGAVFDVKKGSIELRLGAGKVLLYNAKGGKQGSREEAYSMEEEKMSLTAKTSLTLCNYDSVGLVGGSLLSLFGDDETTKSLVEEEVASVQEMRTISLGEGVVLSPTIFNGEVVYKVKGMGNSKPFAKMKIGGSVKKLKRSQGGHKAGDTGAPRSTTNLTKDKGDEGSSITPKPST